MGRWVRTGSVGSMGVKKWEWVLGIEAPAEDKAVGVTGIRAGRPLTAKDNNRTCPIILVPPADVS